MHDHGQIGEANEPAWSDPAYDKLSAEQSVTLDPQKRAQLLWKMQQIMYEQTPWVVLVYPEALQAYNTSKWTGWTRVLNGRGPAFYTGIRARSSRTSISVRRVTPPREAAAPTEC